MAFTFQERGKGNVRCLLAIFFSLVWAFTLVCAERKLEGVALEKSKGSGKLENQIFLWPPPKSKYQHIWPSVGIGWSFLFGSIVGFVGAALGSIGGAGGGAIFVPMLTVIVGFDVKSSTAISKCMITGIAGATVFSKLKMRHPILDIPVIDYDLALLFQPMLLLGITIGVYLNVIFAEWMIIFILVILSLGTASRVFYNGFDTWKKEAHIMRETAVADMSDGGDSQLDHRSLLCASHRANQKDMTLPEEKISLLSNIRWRELCLLIFVWLVFLVLQITKNHSKTCSTRYWVLNFLQIPVAVGVTLFESVSLYRGKRVIAYMGEHAINWSISQLAIFCICGILTGIVGGLLGLGGSFILAPLFLELGIPSQVASATATFVMAFSSPLSVAEYYLLERFPVSDALYFAAVATTAALVGQHLVRRFIIVLVGRASLVIYIFAFLISVSAISLGVNGVVNLVQSIKHGDYIGFEDRCLY